MLRGDRSHTEWVQRPLTGSELAGLWNVPILMQECMSASESDSRLLRALCRGPPGKVLQLGADCLLTADFRGGSLASAPVIRTDQRGSPSIG